MIQRTLAAALRTALARSPATVLLGARQAGKTTLAKAVARETDSVYLDLEAPEDLLKLQDPGAFLRLHEDKLVVLDEIQRAPDLFPVLRGLIDRNRERGRRFGQYLLLGSASPDLLRQSSESLAGRVRYLEMSGLNALETGAALPELRKLWFRGGFPESWLAPDDDASQDWLEDFVRAYLERDVPQLGFRVPAARLRRLWTMLAHLQGEPVNYTKLGANLEVDGKTVSHYIDILTDLFLLRRLAPWHANTKKRLVKSPRFYVRDSGVLHRLLGINRYEDLLAHPVLGKSWEGFVVENIHAVLPRRAETYYYQTSGGAEIDLLIKMPDAELWAVEIKHGEAPKLNPRFARTCEAAGAARKFVVYGGEDEFPIGNGVVVMSAPRLLKKLS